MLVIIFAILVVTYLCSCQKCLVNPYMAEFEFVEPTNHTLVSEVYGVKIVSKVYNTTTFVENNNRFRICYSSYHAGKQTFHYCDNKVFNTHNIRAVKGKNILIGSLFYQDIQQDDTHNNLNQSHNFSFKEICRTILVIKCCAPTTDQLTMKLYAVQHYLHSFNRFFVRSKFNNAKLQMIKYIVNQRNQLTQKITEKQKLQNQQFIFIGIKSSALHFDRREAIRTTWLLTLYQLAESFNQQYINSQVHFHVSFLIGYSTFQHFDPRIHYYLQQEQLLYQDLLLEDTIPTLDSYYTLTDKVLFYFHYLTSKFAKQLDYVIICDDDIYLNVRGLMNLFHPHYQSNYLPKKRFYAGEVR
jgi:hypothetical protein